MRKFNLLFAVLFSALLMLSYEAYAAEKCDTNCIKCHNLSNEKAKEILSPLIPNMNISVVQPAQINGLWEIEFDSGGKKGLVYLDYSFKRMLVGNIIDIKTKVNLTQEGFQKRNPPPPPEKKDLSQIPMQNALVLGETTAKHKIVVFDDPD